MEDHEISKVKLTPAQKIMEDKVTDKMTEVLHERHPGMTPTKFLAVSGKEDVMDLTMESIKRVSLELKSEVERFEGTPESDFLIKFSKRIDEDVKKVTEKAMSDIEGHFNNHHA